jgi:hypothetical protein
LRASHPTLVAASRALATQRNAMVTRWSDWLGERVTATRTVPRPLVERQFGLLLDVFTTLLGPLRRETKPIWARATEHYGRVAAMRGLAAGEVVEEMQYLRELLIRYLAPAIAALRPRQGMALLLRLNRLVDKGVAMAVVGYTDSLVSGLLRGTGGSDDDTGPVFETASVERELSGIAAELEDLMGRSRA